MIDVESRRFGHAGTAGSRERSGRRRSIWSFKKCSTAAFSTYNGAVTGREIEHYVDPAGIRSALGWPTRLARSVSARSAGKRHCSGAARRGYRRTSRWRTAAHRQWFGSGALAAAGLHVSQASRVRRAIEAEIELVNEYVKVRVAENMLHETARRTGENDHRRP